MHTGAVLSREYWTPRRLLAVGLFVGALAWLAFTEGGTEDAGMWAAFVLGVLLYATAD